MRSSANFILTIIYSALVINWEAKLFEGHQTDSPGPYSDWWGPLTPVFANSLNLQDPLINSLMYLFICAAVAESIKKIQSTLLTIPNYSLPKIIYIFFLCFVLTFIIMNDRDGLMLAFAIIGTGVLLRLLVLIKVNPSSRLTAPLLLSTLLFFVLSIVFKIAFFPSVYIYFLLVVHLFKAQMELEVLPLSVKSLFWAIPVGAFALHLGLLNSSIKFESAFPEQQVQFYDLVSVACWSDSTEARYFAKNALESITEQNLTWAGCANLTPASWNRIEEGLLFEPWISRLNANDYIAAQNLKHSWIKLITRHNKDWLEVKINFLGNVLIMSNSIEQGRGILDADSLGETLFRIFIFPIVLLDRFLVFTYAFFLLFYVVLLARPSSHARSIYSLSFLLFTLANQILVYVANNGRYAVPFLILSALILVSKSNPLISKV